MTPEHTNTLRLDAHDGAVDSAGTEEKWRIQSAGRVWIIRFSPARCAEAGETAQRVDVLPAVQRSAEHPVIETQRPHARPRCSHCPSHIFHEDITMTTIAHADLLTIRELHRRWRFGREGGKRAVLTDAVLTDAVLTGADLTDADLTGADLTDAVLTDAVLTDAVLTDADLTRAVLTGARLSDGLTFAQYLDELVPALLTAGGKTLAEVATEENWHCHSWSNCPIHVAFDAISIDEVPALYRWQAERFIQLFDARVIKLEDVVHATA